jgi:hypothetical protein
MGTKNMERTIKQHIRLTYFKRNIVRILSNFTELAKMKWDVIFLIAFL